MDLDFDWYEYASCKGIARSLDDQNDSPFFMEGRGKTYPKARRYCSGCPVVIDCLISALPEGTEGFWGCTSKTNRQTIRKLMNEYDYDFQQAVSEVWEYHRKLGSLVPSPSVWKEW